MNSRLHTSLGLACLLAFALPAAGHAADIAPPPDTSDWKFVAAGYLWGSGLDGQVGVFGLPPQDVNLTFKDLLENLDGAVMGIGEARKGRFMLGADMTYTQLSASIPTPRGILAQKVDVTATNWMVTGLAGYALFETDAVRLDGVVGGRLWSVNNDFDVKGGLFGGRSNSDGATWVDPLAGVKLRIDLTPRIYSTSWAMIGGFGVGSDLMWDLMAGAGYKFNDTFSLFAGYRAVSVDYSDNGFVYDTVQQGPVFAAAFQF